MKIAWQTRSQILQDSIVNNWLSPKANGGNAYDFQAAIALSSDFDLYVDSESVYLDSDNPLSYWWRMRNHLPEASHRILEPYPIVFGGKFNETANIAMIHHVDTQAETGGAKHKWFYKRLFERISGFDRVVTVSQFWKDYLKQKGCENVEVIYNAFDPEDYTFSQDQLADFRENHGFENNRPIIYIGNAAPGKGVYEAYEVLKDSNYQLVMTGGTNKAADLPVKFLSLNAGDYRKLIAACDVVLTMSTMMEGWNRVAHEALLSKTPVIGSGSGGMKELLEGAGQTITTNFNRLPNLVKNCLTNKDTFAEAGYKFVAQYDQAYFKQAWRSIIQ